MARDDDEDDRPRKKCTRDADDDDAEELPRKKSPREEDDEEDDDRPRKKLSRDDDAPPGKTTRPMPTRLVGAIIASLAWGFLLLHATCLNSSNLILQEIHIQKAQREAEDRNRKAQEQMRAAGFNQKFEVDFRGNSERYVIEGTQIFLFLMSVVLVAGGVALLMRKAFGKYLALGAPVGMILVEFTGFVICLIISKGTFLVPYNVGFLVNILFSLVVGGCIAFLLFNKDVSKALK